MFQPTPTPYSPFSSYGAGNAIVDFPGFQPSAGGRVVDSGGPTIFRDPIFLPVNANAHSNANGEGLNYSGGKLNPRFKMDNNDFEEQEALARDFQPSLEGPLVGEKKSSQAITQEYAKADPTYVAKTAALPQKYSHFRPILGDGNCGWRAAGFSYFETLVRLGDKSQLDAEVARITSLNNLISTAGGHQLWLVEDMVEETTILLRDIIGNIHSPETAAGLVLERFNNPETSNAIIYHFRLLASACLRGNPENYQGFIPGDEGVDGYCRNWLEAVDQDIDHLGMSLLIDILLKPIGFAVEIVYLDRSEGSQVNSHMFQAEDANGIPTYPAGPIIHLLYRPSHYDILYKERSSSISHQLVANPNIQVNRATHFSQQHHVQNTTPSMNSFSNLDMSTLLSIPGFGCAPPPSHHGFPAQYSPIEQTYTSSPISASISPVSPGTSPIANSSTASNLSLSTTFPQQSSTLTSPTISTPHSAFPTTTQLPIHTHSIPQSHPIRPTLSTHASMSSHTSDLASPVSASSSFRPSKYEWEAAADWQEGPVVFQTSTFKNSHYNTAHYNNPNFQPEEWTPDCDEPEKGGGRKRSS